jgi:hypothetical protein
VSIDIFCPPSCLDLSTCVFFLSIFCIPTSARRSFPDSFKVIDYRQVFRFHCQPPIRGDLPGSSGAELCGAPAPGNGATPILNLDSGIATEVFAFPSSSYIRYLCSIARRIRCSGFRLDNVCADVYCSSAFLTPIRVLRSCREPNSWSPKPTSARFRLRTSLLSAMQPMLASTRTKSRQLRRHSPRRSQVSSKRSTIAYKVTQLTHKLSFRDPDSRWPDQVHVH